MSRSYPDAVVAGTLIKADHVRILRDYVDEDLDDASISFSWSWSNDLSSNTPIRAVHLIELREAIQELWDSKGRGDLPEWTETPGPGGPSAGTSATLIRATHITDLRAWLNQYEDNHPPFTQGIDSKSYDPSATGQPIIQNISGNDWTGNVAELSSQPLYVRLEIRAPRDPNNPAHTTDFSDPIDYERYRDAFLQYLDRDMLIFPVFTILFYNPVGADFMGALNNNKASSDYFSNTYMRSYAEHVLTFLSKMRSYNISIGNIVVWNEPNNTTEEDPNPAYLTEKFFAALLHRTRKTLYEDPAFTTSMPSIWWGGIFTNRTIHIGSQIEYVKNVFSEMRASQAMANQPIAYPWQGINIHMHRTRTPDLAHSLLKDVRSAQRSSGDEGGLILGEWGVTQEDGPSSLSVLYSQILQGTKPEADRVAPDIMFYFSHHNHEESSQVTWGIQRYTENQSGGVTRFFLLTNDEQTTELRTRYIQIMNPE